jgi:DNA-binding GntR family transcriptional regulator
MLGDRLRNAIADLILSGAVGPGARLDEQALADRFDVSRTPVREALHELAAAGLVEMRPRRPTIVRRFSRAELADSFEAIGEIEGLCARYAAERMNRAERMELQAILEQAETALRENDCRAYRDLDAEIHRLIHVGAHNKSLERIADQLRMQTAPYSSAPYTMPNYSAQLHIPHAQHEAVVHAILDHDAASAHARMVDHIASNSLTVQSILAMKEDLEESEEGSASAAVA